jgi:hypothetical protein
MFSISSLLPAFAPRPYWTGLEAQIRDLKAAGCKRIFSEQVSSVAERTQIVSR